MSNEDVEAMNIHQKGTESRRLQSVLYF